MDTYVAKRDCYWNGLFLKKGQTIKVAKGTVISFNLLEKLAEEEPAPKKAVSKK
ncbi:MAG: hypothetical protein PQJ48_05355 [Sphaerochaetaceae bacterium]|jgi:hypothetical protein|nr:hypothetical protein [uncultured Sphaerochaeta sp.]MDC7229714.1 hypothetical protein [Sphaerochaetaceae bacterium]